MEKKPFVTKELIEEIVKKYPTPFHIHDEKGIRENARRLKKAFAWNKGFKEYFAVKATPNPYILKILKEEGCGVDCSSLTELMLSDIVGFKGDEIMFSSNVTPKEDFKLARELNAYINFDDITHIDYFKEIAPFSETMCLRYNPGGDFTLNNEIMDTPKDAKYGLTKPQMKEAILKLKSYGVKHFGIHSFLASNTKDNGYYGTYHSGEIIYAYGNIDKSIHGFAYNESDYELSNRMLTYFSNFVKFGNPNGEGLIEWKKWDKVQNNILELGSEIKEIEEKYVPAYNIIQEWNERTKQAL